MQDLRTYLESVRDDVLHIRKEVVPAMERVRTASDQLEQITPDDLWALPTYAEMLFVR